ncbi:MAG: hypothetical protein HY904_02380 [Deltaproteobacteria bacterium]|nr:hypothetical protein [Deltaproteobacteria bacterium]
MAPAPMLSPLLATLLLTAADGGPPESAPAPRWALAACAPGVDAAAVLLQARPRGMEGAWDVGWALLDTRGETWSGRGSVKGPPGVDAVPTGPELGWTELDDGTTRLWSPRFAGFIGTARAGNRAAFAPLQGRAGEEVCAGAVWLAGPEGNGAPVLVVLSRRAGVAVGARGDGLVTALPLPPATDPPLPRPPARGRRRAEPAAGAPPSAPARVLADERIRLERVDQRRDPASGRVVTAGWRLVSPAGRALGLLFSRQASVLAEGVVLHRVEGGAEFLDGRTDLVGALLEPLP